MRCASPSVSKAARADPAVDKAVRQSRSLVEAAAEPARREFTDRMQAYFRSAAITDAREIGYGMRTRTAYPGEFADEDLRAGIREVLDTELRAHLPVDTDVLDEDSVTAYREFLATLAEAPAGRDPEAKGTFYGTRLQPGILACVHVYSATSGAGRTAVRTTAIQYAFHQSIDDVKLAARAGELTRAAALYVGLQSLRNGLAARRRSGELSAGEFDRLDRMCAERIQRARLRMERDLQ